MKQVQNSTKEGAASTPLKIYMQPKHEGVEGDVPFQIGDFQVPAVHFPRGVDISPENWWLEGEMSFQNGPFQGTPYFRGIFFNW